MKHFFSLVLFIFPYLLFSQSPEVFFNSGIVFIKNYNIQLKDTAFNNKTYKFPENWKIEMGSDSILISYPQSWRIMEGPDKHLVAFPPDWTVEQSPDGRIVPFPFEEQKITKRIKIPGCTDPDTSKCYSMQDDIINKFGIYTQTGKDNRKIRYTKTMSLALSLDGRLVNIPKNWEISQNSSGRLTAYPKNWDAYEIENKQFAMPKNWEIDFETDSPKIITGKDFLKFIYTPVEKIELAKHIYEHDEKNGLEYLIYLLVNQ
ncbi:MAG TPA: hypothetical protein ENK75_01300 [Saprospiraceae bacterium]|nr:hypothetical protein [Saprospiraceae bacterium]HHH52268.1 hypothetical protein [Bacteroidota bacterium]